MTQLSAYFSRDEFACGCGCGFDTVDSALLDKLNAIREMFDAPITINSGCRCEAYNREIGGSDRSQHLFGRAADIVVRNIPASVVQEYCEDLSVPGLGSYDYFTHVDTRTGHARW